MRKFQRLDVGAFPYFKLAKFNPRDRCFYDGRRAFDSESEARAAAKGPGRFRVSRVEPDGRHDLDPFDA